MKRLEKAISAEPAQWFIERIHPFAQDVGSVVPEGFEAYARVFHPAWRGHPDREAVRWAEIAASTGTVFHAGAQWPHIAFPHGIEGSNELQDPPPGAPWDTRPEEGSLDFDVAKRFVSILSANTSTPHRCFFAVWDGWGALRPEATDAPAFKLPHRRYYLFEGPTEAATESFETPEWGYQSAALWWPDDHAWCAAIEVDFESTYIGGSRDCIEAILAHASLEALEIDLSHGITWDSDTINPNPLPYRH